MNKKLPDTIVVRWEQDNPPWLNVFLDEYHASERGERHRVGIYRLVETKTVELIAKVSNASRK